MTRSKASPFRRFFFELGPGLITGAADDDPSGIATYSVAGARFGYAPLWTALFCFPLMVAMQLMCARLGRVTGRSLAAVVRLHYPRWVFSYFSTGSIRGRSAHPASFASQINPG